MSLGHLYRTSRLAKRRHALFQNSLLVLSLFLVLVSTVACCEVAMSVGRCERVDVHISFLESASVGGHVQTCPIL